MRSLLPLSLALVSLTLGACDTTSSSGETTPADPVETTSAVNSSVHLALSEAATSFEFLNDSELADDLFDLLPGESEETCVGDVPYYDEYDEYEDGWPCDSIDGEENGDGFDVDFQEAATDMAEWVAEEVLTEANVEEVSGNSVTYLLPVDLLCDSMGSDEPTSVSTGVSAAPPAEALACPPCDESWSDEECEAMMEACSEFDDSEGPPRSDPSFPEMEPEDEEGISCEELFAKVPMRLKVTPSGKGHSVDLLVGDKKLNPASAFLAPDELALELDIAGAMDSLETFADAAGEDAPELPSTLEGRIKLGLKKNATENYTVALSVIQAIHVAMEMDGDEMSLKLAASEPTLAITADGQAMALSLDVDLGAIDVSLPGGMFGGEETCSWDDMTGEEYCEEENSMDGQLGVHLGGASVSMVLDTADDDSITVSNAGLGDSTTTASYDGVQILGIDLNPNHGRHLDLTFTSLEDMVEILVDPALVLEVALDLANAPDMAEDAPEFMLDEDLTLSLTGSDPTVSFGDHGMRVESGTLTLTSTSTEDVVVEAGMCMEGGDEGSHDSTTVEAPDQLPPSEEHPEEEFDEEGGDEHPFAEMKAVECE